MLRPTEFVQLVKSQFNIDLIATELKDNQGRAALAKKNQSLFLVAGPGTGKTTCLALRVLKLIFVDAVSPDQLLATTFTRKAASELSSRILGWGHRLRTAALKSGKGAKTEFERLDFAAIRIGTLDGLSEDILTEFRPASENSPVVVEDYARRALMLRSGLFTDGRIRSKSLETFITAFKGPRLNAGVKVDFLCTFRDRMAQDLIKLPRLFQAARNRQKKDLFHRGIVRTLSALDTYCSELDTRQVIDFAGLELKFLEKIQTDALGSFLEGLRYVFVDEYQDTNPLQERIYFALAKNAIDQGGSICVVGDDDQALYRFRGATVELFSQFETRFATKPSAKTSLQKIFLHRNYRSTQRIVDFINEFIELDRGYKPARVPGKPLLEKAGTKSLDNIPVIGIFRNDCEELADALANYVATLVNRGGLTVRDARRNWKIQLDKTKGSVNDIAFLASSVREAKGDGRLRLPFYLRQSLGRLSKPIKVFNPRGQALIANGDVRCVLGLMLECIDPKARIQNSIRWLGSMSPELNEWRTTARQFAAKRSNGELRTFLKNWAARRPRGRIVRQRERVPLNDILYKLISWLPQFVEDTERVVQLEAISRTIADSALFSSFRGEVLFVPQNAKDELAVASVRTALQDIFAPLASGAIDINEDLLETLPHDRLNVMTIHQAKGLEFPITIVDVGSDFRDRKSSKARRFPKAGGETHQLEDFLKPYMPIAPVHRHARDRAFDDIIRQYFVAFSRAKDLLILVGLNSVRSGYSVKSGDRKIENVATGWTRDGVWRWGQGLNHLIHL